MTREEFSEFGEACFKRQVPPLVVLRPDKHRDERSAADRARILKELREKGWTVRQISEVCPLTERRIREAVQ